MTRDFMTLSYSTKLCQRRRRKYIVKEEVDMFAEDFDFGDSMNFVNWIIWIESDTILLETVHDVN